jgi:Undecaprenyl-phosphate galactose phosphotransferase WbaP
LLPQQHLTHFDLQSSELENAEANSISRRALVETASPVRTSACLVLSDVAAVVIARVVALVFWHRINPVVGLEQDFGIWLTALLFPLAYASFGLYGARGLSSVEELRRTVLASSIVSLGLTTGSFLSKDLAGYSRGLFVSSFLLVCVLVPIARACLRYVYASKSWWGVPVLILGAGTTARRVLESLRGQPQIGFKPVACLDDDESKHGSCEGVPVIGALCRAPELAKSLKIHHLLIAMPTLDRSELVVMIERWGATFRRVIVIPNLFGIATLWVSARDLGGVLGLEVRQNLLIPVNRWLKRGIDILLALVFGVFALPIVAVAAVWIKAVSAGPAFYRQEREGENGSNILICKLRTMYPDAEALLLRHLEESPEARDQWDTHFKLKNDPRILPGIGKILRRTSLDELPQIWNVLKGEMSMVGPRPFPTYHLNQFSSEFRELRTRVTPGLTGLWQVSSRSDGDLAVQESLDVYYIRNWSFWLDLYILARTAGAVIFAKGAY